VEAVLGDPVAAVRAAAARAAAQLSPGDAAPLLRRALADPDLWVRYYAARAIGSVGLPDAGDLLAAAATSDAAVPVRIAAAQALAGLEGGPPETLVALANDEVPDVAQAALQGLGEVEGDEAAAALRAALASGDPVRQGAALAGLDGAALAALEGEVEELARTAAEPGVRESAVRALLAGGSERAMSVVCALAGDPARRDGCLRALAAVPGALLPALASVLRDCPEELRLVAVDALSRRGGDEAYRLLARALDDASPAVRGAAAYALGRADLRAALADEHP
jgi:HEAT repeat protein